VIMLFFVLVLVSMNDCACVGTCDHIQVSVQFPWGSSVGDLQHVSRPMRIWAGGCLAHTTPTASDNISIIPQARSCSLLHDKSSSISLKSFCHTTHTESLYEKMISVCFCNAHKVKVE